MTFTGRQKEFHAFVQAVKDLPRHANGLPIRSHFNPMKHAKFLPFVSILEWHKPGKVTFKLIGEEVRLLTGPNAIGLNLYDFYDKRQIPMYKALHDTSFEVPLAYKMARKITKADGNNFEGTSYSVPVTNDDGSARLIYTLFYIEKHLSSLNDRAQLDTLELSGALSLIDMGNGIPNTLPFKAESESLDDASL